MLRLVFYQNLYNFPEQQRKDRVGGRGGLHFLHSSECRDVIIGDDDAKHKPLSKR